MVVEWPLRIKAQVKEALSEKRDILHNQDYMSADLYHTLLITNNG